MHDDRSSTFHELWTQIGDIEAPGADCMATLRADSLRGTMPPLPAMTVDQGIDTDADLSVTAVIGEGGMGTVFLARQRSLERDVAIKQLKPGATDAHRAGLLREGRFMGMLEHPNIVPVHALGLDQEGLPTLVMKRVEGTAWDALLSGSARWEDHGSWPTDPLMRSVLVLIEVCKALQFAHSRGILHRDLKPANVMVGAFGEVYLVDWGIAVPWQKPRDGQRPVGTPAYMAPEMVDPARSVSPATDIYLLGACLFEVLTGSPPHFGPDLKTVLAHAHASPTPQFEAAVPAELEVLCTRSLAVDPGDRPEDVGAFREALVAYIQHRGSIRLATEADERRRGAEAALALNPVDPAAQALYRDGEFAYRQALVEWPENPQATQGLAALLEGRIGWRLDRDDPEGASEDLALRKALGPAEAVEARVNAAREVWETLKARAQEQDPRTRYKDRQRYLVVAMGVLAAASMLQSEQLMTPLVPYGAGWLAFLAVLFVCSQSVMVWLLRRRLLADQVSQRIVMLMSCTAGLVALNRLWCWLAGVPASQVLANDLLLASMSSFMVAIFVRRAMWMWAVICLGGWALILVIPYYAGEIYVAGALLLVLSAMRFKHADALY